MTPNEKLLRDALENIRWLSDEERIQALAGEALAATAPEVQAQSVEPVERTAPEQTPVQLPKDVHMLYWLSSRYMQVVHSDENKRIISWEGFQQGMAYQAALAAQQPPIAQQDSTTDITCDQCIELAEELEKQRALKIVEAVQSMPIGQGETLFASGYSLACEEIAERLKTEQLVLDELTAVAAPTTQAIPDGWISVEDRLPKDGDTVIAIANGSPVLERWMERHESPVGWSSITMPVGPAWDEHEYEEITHWMPLPAAPAPQGDTK